MDVGRRKLDVCKGKGGTGRGVRKAQERGVGGGRVESGACSNGLSCHAHAAPPLSDAVLPHTTPCALSP